MLHLHCTCTDPNCHNAIELDCRAGWNPPAVAMRAEAVSLDDDGEEVTDILIRDTWTPADIERILAPAAHPRAAGMIAVETVTGSMVTVILDDEQIAAARAWLAAGPGESQPPARALPADKPPKKPSRSDAFVLPREAALQMDVRIEHEKLVAMRVKWRETKRDLDAALRRVAELEAQLAAVPWESLAYCWEHECDWDDDAWADHSDTIDNWLHVYKPRREAQP